MRTRAVVAAVIAAAVAVMLVTYIIARKLPIGESAEGEGPRILLVGIDGVDWGRVESMIAGGRLPTLEQLRRDGTSGMLRSIPPYISPSVWTSMATGRTEEKHGIHGFLVDWGRTSMAIPSTSNMRRVKAFWQILTERDMSVGVIGWLVTWPAEPVNGYIVSDRFHRLLNWDDRTDDITGSVDRFMEAVYPSTLLPELIGLRVSVDDVPREDVEPYLGSTSHLDNAEVQSLLAELRRIRAGDLTVLATLRHMTEARPTDLTAVYFRGLDLACHVYWRHMDPASWGWELTPEALETFAPVIERYYVEMDETLGEILELAGENTIVVVCSDHGFAGHRGYPGFEGDVAVGTDMHREDGVLFVRGPGIRKGAEITGASVLDIGPTLLALMGLPVADDMDGRPLTSAMEPGFLEAHPVTTIDTYETGEPTEEPEPIPSPVDEEIKEQLRSLGYIS
jgi:hypothetical protein